MEDKFGSRLLCTGSILNRFFILTAAHCESQAKALLGTDLLSNLTVIMGVSNPIWPHKKIIRRHGLIRKVADFQVHSEYKQKVAYFDVGLIRLKTEITFRNNIWPICLSKRATSNTDEYIGNKPLSIIGYGPLQRDYQGEEPEPLLRSLKVTGFTFDTCQDKYSAVPKTDDRYDDIATALPNLFQDASVFCAGVEGSNAGTCGGDSGGAIHGFNQETQQTFIKGLVHGSASQCDGRRFPPIFINIAHYQILSWIFELVFPETIIEKPKPTSIGKMILILSNTMNFFFQFISRN